MTALTREYFDERIGKVYDLVENFAVATSERFDMIEDGLGNVEVELRAVRRTVQREETDSDVREQDHRRLRELVEENHEPRIANLEAQIEEA